MKESYTKLSKISKGSNLLVGFTHDTFGEKAVAKIRATSLEMKNNPYRLFSALKEILVTGVEKSYFQC
jgi:hypothetical protein